MNGGEYFLDMIRQLELEYMFNLYEYNVKVDNSFFEDWSEDKNKIDELYTLYCVSRLAHDIHKSIVFTNVHLLSMTTHLQKVMSKNYISVYDSLLGLQKKGFIHIKIMDDSVANKFMQPLKIYLLKTSPKRFTLMEHWMYDRSANAKEFFIFAYIAKWKNSDYRISINEWAIQMGYSSQGVEKLLKKMETECRISISSGKYYYHEKLNRYVQEINDYSSVYKEDDIFNTVEGEFTLLEIREQVEFTGWGKIDEFNNGYVEISQSDYNIYRLCVDHYLFPKFVSNCRRIIDNIKLGSKYDSKFEKYEEEYLLQKDGLDNNDNNQAVT